MKDRVKEQLIVRTNPTQAESALWESETISTTSKKLLIVDDVANVARSLQYVLETLASCDVSVAFNGEQALQLFEHMPFDVLITDNRMPGMSGATLAKRVSRLYQQTTIIMVSGDTSVVRRDQAASACIHHILDKPANPAQICRLILDALDR